MRADPALDFALYTQGRLQKDLGRVAEAIEAYQKAAAAGSKDDGPRRLPALNSMLELGQCLSQLGRYEEGNRWLSAAILYDPSDSLKRQEAAYRALSANQVKQDEPLAAFITANGLDPQSRRTANSTPCSNSKVRHLGKRRLACCISRVQCRGWLRAHQALKLLPLDSGRVGRVRQMLPDARGRYVVLLVDYEAKFYLSDGRTAGAGTHRSGVARGMRLPGG